MTSDIVLNALWRHCRRWPRKHGVLHIPPYDSQNKWRKQLPYEHESIKPICNLYKIQNDHPEADQGGHLSRIMGSLAQNHCHILAAREASLLSLFQVERQVLSLQGFALQAINSSKDLYKSHNVYSPPMLSDGVTLFLYLDDALILAYSYSQARKAGCRVAQLLHRLGFVLSLENARWNPLWS